MMKNNLLILLAILLASSHLCDAKLVVPLRLDDPSSPLTREAIEKRNLKMHKIASKKRIEAWQKSERNRIGSVQEWEAAAMLKASEAFTPLKGGALFEEDFGKWTIKLGTWGEKDGWSFLKVEW